ncbi:RNA polymerase sigma factor [Streptomyces antibioticus]|uniref:RNA polymerase sigma factor n=1 Tax=Streptomyces antibioticus TaxID=1890 RepID=UPI003F457D22
MPGIVAERSAERPSSLANGPEQVTALRAARLERGWSLKDLAVRLWAEANRQAVSIGTHPASARALIIGWELGRRVPTEIYANLLTAVYGADRASLGLPAPKPKVSMASPALEELFTQYWGFVRGWHVRRVGDFHLAEDLASETFIRAAEAVDGVDIENPYGWLAKQAAWVLADHRRTQRRHREQLASVNSRGEVADFTEWTADDAMSRPEETVTGYLSALDVIEGLSERERELVVLRFLDGLPMVEVEKRMGLSKTSARRIFNRAMATMRANAVVVWELPATVGELETAA